MSIETAPAFPDHPTSAISRLGQDSAQRSRLQHVIHRQDARPDTTVGPPPELSAAGGIWPRQWVALAATVTVAAVLSSLGATHWLMLALIMPFAGIVAIRGLALAHALRAPPAPILIDRVEPDALLPPYSILVPLYREQTVARQLVASLAALDYPTRQLQILFITERDDEATRTALRAAGLAAHMAIVIVPEGRPRTKPRALNHALGLAVGEFVVVYDAEDEPEPDQLRRAVAAFRGSDDKLGCLQAALRIDNARTSWLTAQFAIEYAALFDGVLPALQRFGLPIALGGTSNHFPRHVLQSVGAWDAYNVTEDADLGFRLARLGWRVGMLPSSTVEEAPPLLRDWLGQRRRWLKGWLQTAIVITRQPRRLLRELGPRRFLAAHLLLAGMLLSAFVHPIYLATLGWTVLAGDLAAASPLWWTGLAVFVAGYAVSVVLAAMAAARQPHRRLLRQVVGIPIYWLLISVAAYGALWDYVTKPFHWIKTPHRGRNFAVRSRT
jgi:cellulose synthase/poly-beta-1,6-N-acetylglucosamine synthase-like glycosyltransferase